MICGCPPALQALWTFPWVISAAIVAANTYAVVKAGWFQFPYLELHTVGEKCSQRCNVGWSFSLLPLDRP
jgi:hypothetical protein